MDDILDFDWVLSHETQIEEKEATLFQQCVSMDLLLIGSAMLFENNIPFQIKTPKPNKEDPINFGSIQEIHINENNFEKAAKLLDQLLNINPNYPKRLPAFYSEEELKNIFESNSNPYKEILLRMEFEERGIYYEKEIEEENGVVIPELGTWRIIGIILIFVLIIILSLW